MNLSKPALLSGSALLLSACQSLPDLSDRSVSTYIDPANAPRIEAALPDRDSERATACAVLRKKFKQPPADFAAQQRAARFLAYRGFDHDTIRHALDKAWQDEEEWDE